MNLQGGCNVFDKAVKCIISSCAPKGEKDTPQQSIVRWKYSFAFNSNLKGQHFLDLFTLKLKNFNPFFVSF